MSVVEDPRVDLSDPQIACEQMELTAAELERRAERMLKLSRDLLAQASLHQTLKGLPEERTLSRNGDVVTEVEAIRVATELGEFTRAEFADALGLKPVSVSRWLSKLIQREHPIIERRPDGKYAYLVPNPVSELLPKTSRPKRAKGFQTMFGTEAEGSGNTMRGFPKELRPIVRDAVGRGWTLIRTGSGHWTLEKGERKVGFASTPRNASNEANKLRQKLSGTAMAGSRRAS